MERDAQPSPMAVSAAAYANAIDRLRINFRVAIWTNLLAVAVLLGAAATSIWLIFLDEFAAASVSIVVSLLDVVWGVTERPWRQLWLANNRIALSDSLWVAYLESKGAIEKSGLGGDRQLSELLAAQSIWVERNGAIARDDYEAAFAALREIAQRPDRLQSALDQEAKALAPYEDPTVSAAERRLE